MKNKFLKYYTPFFCEENCWQLVNSFSLDSLDNYYVLFLTNETKTIALTNQKISPEGEFVIWDYHVIVYNSQDKEIYDFDSRLNFPEEQNTYIEYTWGDQNRLPENYRTLLRVIPAKAYMSHFYSDRKHMLDNDGKELQPFPIWPCIMEGDLTLQMILDTDLHNDSLPRLQFTDEFFDRNKD